jgi:hypothetical protein
VQSPMAFVLFTRALPAWHGGHHLGGVGSALLRQRAATTLSHPDDAWELSPSWRDALSDQLAEPYFTELQQFVEAERRANTVLPSREDQFAAFAACDFERVRVVILGQDPYPTPGHAHGLAFSVLPTVQPLPGSLRNVRACAPRCYANHHAPEAPHALPPLAVCADLP